jgi:hypothetical protein
MACCAGSPVTATVVRTVTLSRSCRSEPQASLLLPKASDTPMSEAAGMVVADLELLVAEVGDELEGAAQGCDEAVEDVLSGHIAAFDLGDAGDRDAIRAAT